MKSYLLDALKLYVDKIDRKEMTIKEFRAEFDSAFEEAMISCVHPYGRDEFKNDFYNVENGGSSK